MTADTTPAPTPEPLHRLDAERAVLGALLDRNQLMERMAALTPEHFFDPVHGRIFAKLREEIGAGRFVDTLALRGWANADAGLRELKGSAYLLLLLGESAILDSQALQYADIVRDMAQRRALAEVGEDIAMVAREPDAEAETLIVEAERRLAEIADEHAPFGTWRPLGDVMEDAVAAAEAGEALGLSTGIGELDEITGGVATDGKLWVIGGPSSSGKSLVGAAIAIHLARAGDVSDPDNPRGVGVGYIHLEMGERGSGLRAATAMAHERDRGGSRRFTDGNPSYLAARRQKLSQSGWARLHAAATEAKRLPIRIDARPHQTLAQIEAGARRLQRLMARAGTPLKVLFIDHEGLIKAEQRRNAKWEEVSDRWIRLQGLAKKLDIAIVCLTQINRDGAAKEGDQRPHMGHLANSADIERCADVIILLYREAYFAQRTVAHDRMSDDDIAALERARKSNLIELIVDKSRDGERKTVKAILDVRTGYLGEDVKPEPRVA